MPIEWSLLVAISGVYWGLGQVTGVAKTKVAGVDWNRGNRETDPPVPGWVTRTEKAQKNLLESYPLFLSLVVVLTFANKLGGMATLGALVWFAARLAHAALFMKGITGWRTGAYLVSLVGLGLMFTALAI